MENKLPSLDVTNDMEAPAEEQSYSSTINLPSTVLEDAQEGEEITIQVSGSVVTKEDGSRCFEVSTVEGQSLSNIAEDDEANPADNSSTSDDAPVAKRLDAALKKIATTSNKY